MTEKDRAGESYKIIDTAPASHVYTGGLLCNLLIWALLPQVSWLWWNVTGFAAGWIIAIAVSLGKAPALREKLEIMPALPYRPLLAMFLVILGTSLALELQ